jgi:predicted nucleotidyltransferase
LWFFSACKEREVADQRLEPVITLLDRTPQVRFAYLFGSYARGDAGPLSDIDLAVFLTSEVPLFDFRLQLMEALAQATGDEALDLIILNDAPVVLRYEVVRGGKVIKEHREMRIAFEARTLGEYLDTEHLRRTQAMYLKEQLRPGDCHGQ